MSRKMLVLCALLIPTLALGQNGGRPEAPFTIGGGYQSSTTATLMVAPLSGVSYTGCWKLQYVYWVNGGSGVQVPPPTQYWISLCGPYSNSTSVNITAPASVQVSASLIDPGGILYATAGATFGWPYPGKPTPAVTPGSGRFTVSWPAVTNTYDQNNNIATSAAASYNVKISGASGGPYQVVASGTTALSWTDPSVPLNAVYYVVVSAVNAYGVEGPNSAQVRASSAKIAP